MKKSRTLSILLLGFFLVAGYISAEETPEWLWAQKAGGTSADNGNSISLDSEGNSYVAGVFQDTGYFGSTTLTGFGGSDIFVAKLSSTGQWLWAQKAGGTSTDNGNSISLDSEGNSYVVGFFQGTGYFGDKTLVGSGGYDIFVAKLSSTGQWLWAQQAGGTTQDLANSISLDSEGNSYVVGYFISTGYFGSTTLTGFGNTDIFIAKLSSTGQWLWAQQAGSSTQDHVYSISIGSGGDSYTIGTFQLTGTFGGTTLVSSGTYDIFVAKLSSAGQWLWVAQAGGVGSDVGRAVNTDSAGNSYIAGIIGGTGYFGSTTLTGFGQSDLVVAKLSSTGQWLRAQKAGSTVKDYGYGIDIDSEGNSYAVGYFGGTAVFGAISLVSSGTQDMFVAKLGIPPLISSINGIANRTNVIPNFNYGTTRKTVITLSTMYPLTIRFKNTSPVSVNYIELPGGFKRKLDAPLDPNAKTDVNINVKYFNP